MYTTTRSFPKNVIGDKVPVINIRQVPESLDLTRMVSPGTKRLVFWIVVLGLSAIVFVSWHQIWTTEDFIKAHN